jgi:hypothetical protein
LNSENCSCPSDKNLSKNGSAHKGDSLCVKDVFAKKILVPGEIPLAALEFRYRLDSEQLHNFCDYNGLDCLTVANGTTGAQRFFAALSHRASAMLPPFAMRPRWVAC